MKLGVASDLLMSRAIRVGNGTIIGGCGCAGTAVDKVAVFSVQCAVRCNTNMGI